MEPRCRLPGKLFEDDRELFTKQNMAIAGHIAQADVAVLIGLFEDAKNFGSLIRVPPKLTAKLPEIEARTRLVAKMADDLYARDTAAGFLVPVIEQAKLAGSVGTTVWSQIRRIWAAKILRTGDSRGSPEQEGHKDARRLILYACFIQRDLPTSSKPNGFVGMITIPNWMFLSSISRTVARSRLFDSTKPSTASFTITGGAYSGSDFGSCSFVFAQ